MHHSHIDSCGDRSQDAVYVSAFNSNTDAYPKYRPAFRSREASIKVER